jgi:hypothetical protein
MWLSESLKERSVHQTGPALDLLAYSRTGIETGRRMISIAVIGIAGTWGCPPMRPARAASIAQRSGPRVLPGVLVPVPPIPRRNECAAQHPKQRFARLGFVACIVRTSRRKRAGRAEESGPHLKGCGEFDGPQATMLCSRFRSRRPHRRRRRARGRLDDRAARLSP